MKKNIILSLVLMATVIGCSNDTSQSNNVEVTTEPVAETTVETTEEVTETVADESYTYTDVAEREVFMEKSPESVAVTYMPLWESLILLDANVVAASGAENYLATWDAFEGVNPGTPIDIGLGDPNLELLAEIAPDITLHQVRDISSYDIVNLEQVTNVALFDNATRLDWRLSLIEVGKLIGKEDKAYEVIEEVESELAESNAKIKEVHSDDFTVAQFTVMAEDSYHMQYTPELYDDEIGLGLNTPEGFATTSSYEQVTLEALALMNPDYLFVNVFDADTAIYEALEANPIFQNLDAYKNGHVYILDGSGHGNSALCTIYKVRTITDILLKVEN
ncbi:MAG: ABC transporter substrate-binding protein [Lachnospirales bacterium]